MTCPGSWMSSAPELWLLGTALAVGVLGRRGGGEDGESLGYLSFLGMTGALAAVLLDVGAAVRRPWGGLIIVDGLAVFLTVFVLAAGMMAVLMAAQVARAAEHEAGNRPFFVLISALGMLLMVKSLDLVLIALGLGLYTAATCFLVQADKAPEDVPRTLRTHLQLGSLSLAAFLLGALLLKQGTGTTNLARLGTVLPADAYPCDPLRLQGFVLVLAGLGIPLAFVPFHGWALRLCCGASPAVIAWMDVGAKAAGLAVIARLWAATPALAAGTENAVCVLAVATIAAASVAALGERDDLARMLTYIGIAHAGFVLLGVIAGGALGWSAVLYFVAAYGCLSLGTWTTVLWLTLWRKCPVDVEALAGLGLRSPALGAILGIFLLALAGIPPLSGFMAKLFILNAVVNAGHHWLALIGTLHCLVCAYCCLRVVAAMYLEEPTEGIAVGGGGPVLVVAVAALAGVLLMGVWPDPLLGWAWDAVRWLIG